MGNNLTSIGALAYQGTNAKMPPNMFVIYNNVPGPTDYQNFQLGDFWINLLSRSTNNAQLYVLLGKVQNIANWVLLSGNSGSTVSLTGNTGGPVPPLAGNINVVGDGTTVTVAGDPSTHTLTITATNAGDVIGLETDDTHIVTPTSGVIKIHGGTGISTTGTVGPNTVTISTAGSVATSYVTDSGTAIPASGVLDVNGDGNNITTVGSGHQVKVELTGITNHSLQVGGSTNNLTQLGVATNGQLPIGSTGANPVLSTLTAGSGINITNGAGSITIAATAPSTPASFFAYNSMHITNVTGDGTQYQIIFDTENWDLTSSYNTSTGQFTAPVNGLYTFFANVYVDNIQSNFNSIQLSIDNSNVTYSINSVGGPLYSPSAVQNQNNRVGSNIGGSVYMNAGDTAVVDILIGGGSKVANISAYSTFSGYLTYATTL